MTIFSSFSANFPPHYHTILAINCVHASNWFTHLQQIQQTDGQSDNSVLTVYEAAPSPRTGSCYIEYQTSSKWYFPSIKIFSSGKLGGDFCRDSQVISCW